MKRQLTIATFVTVLVTTALVTTPAVVDPAEAAGKPCPAATSSVLRQTHGTYSRTVALTFDDGPSEFTPKILDILKKEKVKATFFVTGQKVDRDKETARRIVDEGHVIANHTYTHPQFVAGSVPHGRFDALPAAAQRAQMDKTTRSIRTVTGKTPCYFRGPGGAHFGSTTGKLARQRTMSVVHWTVSTSDSGQSRRTTPYWVAKIARQAKTTHRHPIILMHDGKASPEPESTVSSYRGNTVAALPSIIRYYKAKGYVFTDPRGWRL